MTTRRGARFGAWLLAAACLGGVASGVASRAVGDEDGAADDGVPAKELLVAGDEMKRYFLIGPHEKKKAPKEGWGCLIVMPGGTGSAEFHGFVKNIWASCCPDDFVAVQL